jgi:hypothetical protein
VCFLSILCFTCRYTRHKYQLQTFNKQSS